MRIQFLIHYFLQMQRDMWLCFVRSLAVGGRSTVETLPKHRQQLPATCKIKKDYACKG